MSDNSKEELFQTKRRTKMNRKSLFGFLCVIALLAISTATYAEIRVLSVAEETCLIGGWCQPMSCCPDGCVSDFDSYIDMFPDYPMWYDDGLGGNSYLYGYSKCGEYWYHPSIPCDLDPDGGYKVCDISGYWSCINE